MRMWEIREGSSRDKYQEAYEAGFEDGYRKALEEDDSGRRMSSYREGSYRDGMGYRRR